MSKRHDMTGRKYGRLTAIRPTGMRSGANNRIWEFACDCGSTCSIDGYVVRSGNRKQCASCSQSQAGYATRTHGMSETSEFGIWTDIQTRCYNPKFKFYRNYGGRGITVCDRWRDSFKSFLADMGPRPKGKTLDRINNDGNYDPSNCRWATVHEQSLNRRTNIRVTILGITKTVSQWADDSGMKYATVLRRYHAGWKPTELLSPVPARGEQ